MIKSINSKLIEFNAMALRFHVLQNTVLNFSLI